MNTINTQFGEVSLQTLVKRYETQRKQDMKNLEKRREFLQTDEGIAWNRGRAKSYYEKNRELVLAKRKAIYAAKKQTQRPGSPLPSELPEFTELA